jgi:hypothetical protein
LRAAALLALVAGWGCGEPKVDSAQLERSVAQVRKSVEKRRQGDFDFAWKTVQTASRGEVEGTPPFAVDGMTAAAIFAEAEKIGWRRDLVWAERAVVEESQVVNAHTYLERLPIRDFVVRRDAENQVFASFFVENRLDSAVDTAWLRIDAPRPDGGTLGGEDLVDFQPPLAPGERRNIQIQVTSEAARVLAEEPTVLVAKRFTLVGLRGNTLYQEPTPEALERARRRLADEERHRDELRAKLRG